MRHTRHSRALTLASVAALLALAACTGESSTGSDDPEPTGSTATDTTSPTDDPTSTDDTGTPTPQGAAVPLYFAGDTPRGPRLFREFQRVEGDALTEAALTVAGGSADDPDYRTLWPGDSVTGAALGDGVIEVTLNADAFTEAPDGMRKAEARLAIQQMVYSLQGVAQERLPVQFVRESGPSRLFGIDVSKPVKQGDWMTYLAMVNVTDPAQGATVDGDTLEASGVASSFEGTVPWQVKQGDTVVLEGFATAEGWMEKLYPWEASIDVSDLSPGTYTFVASTDDPSGGEGGGPTTDSKEFTLR
ncbi:MAG: Gmad2 immunoglobulin-like domain-containing protein [Nocardioides sp.]|uniref:Gmad2 immunoglobulin-like domain-containing protein n=1 Tax=Nocardioides sp. TaxID=35761 RepID=UPI003F02F5B9